MNKFFILMVLVILSTFATVSCNSIKYPNCEADKDCKNKNPENKDEVCFNKQCVECNKNDDCKNDYLCKEHKCVPECTTNADCVDPKVCKNEKCEYECTQNSDCESGYCRDYKCGPQCTENVHCNAPEVCIDNECLVKQVEVKAEICTLTRINFDFNEHLLTSDARAILEKNAECIKSRPATIIVEGHCDERGTDEYNLNLGQKRASAVKRFLNDLGVNVTIKSVSKGEEEPLNSASTEEAWSENRRAEIRFE